MRSASASSSSDAGARRPRRRPRATSRLGPRDEIGGRGHAACPALAGRLEQQHGAGHRDVERLARRHRDRHRARRAGARGRGRCVSWPSTNAVGPREVDALGRGAARCDARRGGARRRAERSEDLHGGHALHDPDCETRAGRGAHDLRIVRVDRSRPEDDYLRAGGRGAAHQRARVAGIAELGGDEREVDAVERFDARAGRSGASANTACGVAVSPTLPPRRCRAPRTGTTALDGPRRDRRAARGRVDADEALDAARRRGRARPRSTRGPSHTNTPSRRRASGRAAARAAA